MTEIHDPAAPRRDEFRSCWRTWPAFPDAQRDHDRLAADPAGRRELRLGCFIRLQDSARQVAADIEAAEGAGRALDPALFAAGRLAAFEEDTAGIRAVTTGPGCPEAGDRGLWELVAVRRAQARLTALRAPAEVPASRTRAAADRWV